VATARTDARGDYRFGRLDLGTFRIVVTPPAGGAAVVSRAVPITRGGEIRGVDVGLPPVAATPAAPKPTAARPGVPQQAAGRLASPLGAAFAGLAGAQLGAPVGSRPRSTGPAFAGRPF
jgi:hypothetical protein